MKKTLLLLIMTTITSASLFAVTHGSIVKKDAPLDQVISKYNPDVEFPTGAKIDFKAVTAGGKLWAMVVGTGYELAGNNWSSQVRIYTPALHEISLNNDPNYITVDRALRTTIVSAYPFTAPISQISVSQEDNNNFNGPGIWNYNVNAPNSGLSGDAEKPLLIKVEEGVQTGSTLPINCSASDNSGDYFFLITDVANNYTFVSFIDNFTITGLKPATAYTLSVIAVDFSGNESEPVLINVGEKPYESVLEGVAGDISFELGSTETSLQIRAKAVNSTATITNFKVQIGNEETIFTAENPMPFEAVMENWQGLSTLSYTISNSPVFTSAPNGIVYLSFTYLLGPIEVPPVSAEDWADVYAQTKTIATLTQGARKGERISIKMGDGEIKTAIQKTNVDQMTLLQEGNLFTINSVEKLRSIKLYSSRGQFISSSTSSNSINAFGLSQGVYFLKSENIHGDLYTFKVIVK